MGLSKSRWQILATLLLILVATRRGWCQYESIRRLPAVNAEPVNPTPSQSGFAPTFPEQLQPFDGHAPIYEADHFGACPIWNQSCWEFYAGLLFMEQSPASSPVPLVMGCFCGDETFIPNGADYNPSEGFRTSVIWRHPNFSCCPPCPYALELTYFGVNDPCDRLMFEGDLLVLDQFVPAGSATVDYGSRLSSVEFNCRCPATPWREYLFGVRWVELNENSSVGGIDWMPRVIVNESRGINNGLLGLQVGIDQYLWDHGGLFTANAYAKAGLYNNHMALDVRGAQPYSASANDIAFVGDFQIIGRYELTRCLAATAGYQFLWLSGVGQALDQYYNTYGTIHRHESALFHGQNVGLEFRW